MHHNLGHSYNRSVMIMGKSLSYFGSQITFLFNMDTEKFFQMPDMVGNRTQAGCALFNSPMHDGRPVVAIGGGQSFDSSDNPGDSTIEVLDYTQADSTWREGKAQRFHWS